eukprot:Gb_27302 [translate_table: standard]
MEYEFYDHSIALLDYSDFNEDLLFLRSVNFPSEGSANYSSGVEQIAGMVLQALPQESSSINPLLINGNTASLQKSEGWSASDSPHGLAPSIESGNTSCAASICKQENSNSRVKVKSKKKNIQRRQNTSKLSVDPQSVAARHRRHRISKRFKILQKLVPGGTKMDTASMLDEAIQYVKFLKTQIWIHEMMGYGCNPVPNSGLLNSTGFSPIVQSPLSSSNYSAFAQSNTFNTSVGYYEKN